MTVRAVVVPPAPHRSTGWRPARLVTYCIQRKQPREGPDADVEKYLRQWCHCDHRTGGKYQPEGPDEEYGRAGAGDPIPGRELPIILRGPTPICRCTPWCASGQTKLEEDDDTDQTRRYDANLDFGHGEMVADRDRNWPLSGSDRTGSRKSPITDPCGCPLIRWPGLRKFRRSSRPPSATLSLADDPWAQPDQ